VRIGVGALLVAVGAGAAYELRHDDVPVATRGPAARACPTPAQQQAAQQPVVPAALPKAQQVRLVLLNGTDRNGLAKTVGDQLAAQGFVVMAQGNAPAALIGASTVTFGTGAEPAATLLARWVLGARLVGNPRAPRGSLQVVLGSAFQRLASPVEVAAAGRSAPVTRTVPSAAAVTRPTGCPA
jgi:hypothetical protein